MFRGYDSGVVLREDIIERVRELEKMDLKYSSRVDPIGLGDCTRMGTYS